MTIPKLDFQCGTNQDHPLIKELLAIAEFINHAERGKSSSMEKVEISSITLNP
jgi:hypothetical protein